MAKNEADASNGGPTLRASAEDTNRTPHKRTATKAAAKKAGVKKIAVKNAQRKDKSKRRKKRATTTPSRSKVGDRRAKGYPSESLGQVMHLGENVVKFAGDKIRRLTLMHKMERSPSRSAVRLLITNSANYGVTTGSYQAEWIELTKDGRIACDPAQLFGQLAAASNI